MNRPYKRLSQHTDKSKFERADTSKFKPINQIWHPIKTKHHYGKSQQNYAISTKIHLRKETTMLDIGTQAPNFTLKDKDGNTVSLSDFVGRKVVLYFYPKDNTPGCTRQACAFAGLYEEFKARNVQVIGISRDSVASHEKFAAKYSLPFILLSDPELEAIEAYGVWQEKKLYGKVSMGVVRTTFVIDEAGRIERIMPRVKPDTNAAEILATL